MFEIYTDGACSPNPGKGGWAVIVTENNKIVDEFAGVAENTTNNIMEMTAVIEALKYSNKAIIYSDSAYIINCMNEKWYLRWQKNHWMRDKREMIRNREFWEEILRLKGNAAFKKVKGHADNIFNNRADALCVDARNSHT